MTFPRQWLTAALVLSLLLALCPACRPLDGDGSVPTSAETGTADGNRNIRYGLPGKAFKNADKREAYLIERPQYVLSYSDVKKNPNWVSWQLVYDDWKHHAD